MMYKSHAKVNLALDILRREENGYHIVQTVLQKIPLYDEILVEESSRNSVIFEGKETHLIDPNLNTVVKTIKLLKLSKKYKIIIKKNIPLSAGLGGGSSNAATVLNALNETENLGLSNNELRGIGSTIGVDTSFFIEPGTAFGEHYGEQITILPDLKWENFYKILIIPHIRKQTILMYNKIDLSSCGKNKSQTIKMIEALKNEDHESVFDLIHNDFETVANRGFLEMKKALMKNGATHCVLCGSGTAVLGLSNNPFDLKALSQELPNQRILSLPQ